MDTQTFLTYTCRNISECNIYYIYTTGNSGDDLTVAYTDCEGNFKTDTVIAPGGTINYTLDMRVCASEILDPGRGIVTQEGPCGTFATLLNNQTNLCTFTGNVSKLTSTSVTEFSFVADYIMLTYQFTDGKDLDTRTRIVSPNVGQTSQSTYLGWGRQNRWPVTGTQFLTFSGDNTGTGYEAVLLNLIEFKSQYPSATEIVVDLRGFWYDNIGNNPVNVHAVLWKGGTPIKSGFTWTNSSATNTYDISSVSKAITLSTQDNGTSGQRIATLTYNLQNNQGSFNSNDTTTPSV